MKGALATGAEDKTVKGRFIMDNQKKDKIVAIILTTLVSLAVSVAACILGISPDALTDRISGADISATSAVCRIYDGI